MRRKRDSEEFKAYQKSWRLRNPDYLSNWISKNRARVRECQRKWRQANPEKVRLGNKLKMRRRRLQLNHRILNNIRSGIYGSLRNGKKYARTSELLGCSIDSFKIYIESKWEEGMTWENWGLRGWHIDHIMPVAIFDLTKKEHQARCFHFSNLQPLWAHENQKKSKKVIRDHQFQFIL